MNLSEIKQLVSEQQDYIIKMRREFHRYPEVSGKEFHTREILIREMERMNIPYKLLDGTGMIAVIKGAKPGKHRVLRADIDGLPMKEDEENLKQKKECLSCVEGTAHTCGHDAHMAMLLGTMKVLTKLQEEMEGTVYCCFEEGEETNCGVETMLKALAAYPIDECFALHVYYNLEAGKINIVPGPRMAGTVAIGVFIKGKSGHSSRPDQAVSPIIPAANMITQWNCAFVNQLNAEETVTLGLGMLQAGKAVNVIPDEAYIGGTARFFDTEEGERAYDLINRIAENTAACHNCSVTYEKRHRVFPYPVVNDEKLSLRIQETLKEICGPEVLGECERWFASETYSAYQQKYPGVLGFLGIRNEEYGSGAVHHNGKFDIDESALALGTCAELAFVFGK